MHKKRTNIIFFVLIVLSFFTTIGCTAKENKTPAKEAINNNDTIKSRIHKDEIISSIENYDSIKFFQDANWINLKGVHEIKSDSLQYPFITYIFRQGNLVIGFYYSRTKKRYWHMKNLDGKMVLHLKKYVGGDIMDTVHNYFLFREKENFYIDCTNSSLKPELDVRVILKTVQIDSSSIEEKTYFTMWGDRKVTLKDLLNFNDKFLSKTFDVYGERLLQIRQGFKLFRTYDYENEFYYKKITKNTDPFLMETLSVKNSFIFYFVDRFSYMEVVK